MIPIDEQIRFVGPFITGIPHGEMFESILASLEELKRIREVQVPEEPSLITVSRGGGSEVMKVAVAYIDTLRDLLKRESARADAAHEVADSTTKGVWSETLLRYAKAIGEHQALGFDRNEWKERAEAAESKLPIGMKHCTIVFEECPVGHGNLRGTNWVKHDCLVCRAEAAEAKLAAMLKLGEEPSEEILKVGADELYWRTQPKAKTHQHVIELTFKAMFAKLAEQAGVK